MTANEICLKLISRFPKFLKDDAEELKDIEDALKGFADSDLELIWNEYRDTWSVGYAPRRANFVKIAYGLNLKRSGGAVAEYVHVCYICASRSPEHTFPIDVWPCPQCGNTDRPFYAIAKRGAFVPKEHAERILMQYPKGPHPIYGIKAPLKQRPLEGTIGKLVTR